MKKILNFLFGYDRKDISMLKVGDEIEIISFPRPHDGADAYAEMKGIVDFIKPHDKFRDGQVGSICLDLYGKGWFIGVGIQNRLKFRKLN